MCWSAFFVAAHTGNPEVWYECAPDSGYSVDNLAPGVPANIAWESPAMLVWDEAVDADFDYFTVYGSDDIDFGRSAEVVGYTIETSYNLAGSQDIYQYYFVTATDFSGNEGGFAILQTPADVELAEGLPQVFALRSSTPNPFTKITTLSFDLPVRCAARLAVYDAGGRLVRTLIDRTLPAGRHRTVWDGRSIGGKSVAPGIYFARFRAGEFGATDRLVLLR
jgi:hypothetical protein